MTFHFSGGGGVEEEFLSALLSSEDCFDPLSISQ